jgi:hypothetical protein
MDKRRVSEVEGSIWCTSGFGFSPSGGISTSSVTSRTRLGFDEMAWRRWCLAGGEKGWPGSSGPFYRGFKWVRRSTNFQSSAPSSLWFPILDCDFCSQVFKLKSIPSLSLFTSVPSVSYQPVYVEWCMGRCGHGHGAARSGGGAVRRRDRVSAGGERKRGTIDTGQVSRGGWAG